MPNVNTARKTVKMIPKHMQLESDSHTRKPSTIKPSASIKSDVAKTNAGKRFGAMKLKSTIKLVQISLYFAIIAKQRKELMIHFVDHMIAFRD